jgi:hypothetical protein
MSYTSPSPANVGLNGNQTTWWIPARNLSTHTATNVVVNVAVDPIAGLAPVTYLADVGTFNFTTGNWNVGTLAAGTTKWLKIVTSVTDIGLAPFTVTSVITGDGIDPNNVNNTLVQTLTSVVTTVTAGAVTDTDKCACIDVSENDQACNYGDSEWRLNTLSVVNSTTYAWDEITGKGNFTFVDPTLPITGAYSLWCDPGTGFVEISGPATFTINPIIEDKEVFDHTVLKQTWAELTAPEKIIVQALIIGITYEDFCYIVTRNADGDITSAYQEVCDVSKDTRTFFLCTDELCDPAPDCECEENLPIDIVLPVEYNNPEEGDTIVLRHVTSYATSVWVFNGNNWVRSSCGCMQDAMPITTIAFSGTATKTLTINFADGSSKTASFTDLTGGGGGEGDNWGDQVIEHADCSLSSGDGTAMDPLLVENVVAEHRFSSTQLIIESSNANNVSTFFTDPCPAGCPDPVYTLGGYSNLVYENVTLVGTLLGYDIKATAPAGNHPIIINRTCT